MDLVDPTPDATGNRIHDDKHSHAGEKKKSRKKQERNAKDVNAELL